MTTIRVQDWTKERIDEIKELEEHSSRDSVLKTLLLYRQFGEEKLPAIEGTKPEDSGSLIPAQLLGEARIHEATIYCPGCGTVHENIGLPMPMQLTAYEAECGDCGSPLFQATAVAVDAGYDGVIDADLLKATVLGAWENQAKQWARDGDTDGLNAAYFSGLVQFADDFGWDWTPRYMIRSLEELEPDGVYEIPLADRVGPRAWRITEVHDDHVDYVKVNGSSGSRIPISEPSTVLDGAQLDALVEDGEVRRVFPDLR